ncbi:MAG: tandem-95 repeat protein, partial [Shimia sp.]|nr:tandem-95 repeat protein [Shimia sp.]
MGYLGRGYHRNTDMEVDVSGASRGQYIWTRRGDDAVTGSSHRDVIFTGRGDDTVEGGGGNDVMFGGRGKDTAIFSGSVLDYQVLSFGRGRWNLVQGADGCDFLHSFEVLQFDDFALDLTSNNDPLVILRDDGLETSEGEALSFQVDFYDLDGSSVELVSASVTGGGTLTTQNSGASQVGQFGVGGGTTVSFDPGNAYDSLGAGESTTETVTLVISDGQGGNTTVTYEITIEGQNDAPLALAVSATATEDSPILVAADYSDIDTNDTHSFSIDTTGTLGTVTNNGDGTFSYDPTTAFNSLAAGESATDTFTYTVDDGNVGTSTETVTITIQGQNDAPVAMAVSDTSDEDGPTITVSADFSDVDASDTFTFSVDTTGTLGTVTNNGDGTFDYDPNGAFEHLGCDETATDTFTYTVDDGNGGTSTETVTVTIQGSNDAPVVSSAVVETLSEDSPVTTLDLLANASDAEGDALAISEAEATSSDGRSLSVAIDPVSGAITLDPAQFNDLAVGEEETIAVTYDVVEADRGYTDVAAGETLDNAGTFFIADDDTGSLIRIKRSASINTPDQAIAAAGVENGTLIVVDGNSSGLGISPRLIIDGVASSVGIDGIDLGGYTGPTTSDTAEVPARFLVVNGDLNNETIVVEIPRADADCGDANHVFTLTGVSQGNGISYTTPLVGGIGLEVSPEGVSATAEITIQGANDAPEAEAVTADVNEDGPSVTVSADFSDADASDTHTFSVDTTGTLGTVTNNGDGTFDYDTNGAFENLAVGETAT